MHFSEMFDLSKQSDIEKIWKIIENGDVSDVDDFSSDDDENGGVIPDHEKAPVGM